MSTDHEQVIDWIQKALGGNMDDESKAVCSLFIKELATNIRDISTTLHQLTDETHDHSMAISVMKVKLDEALTSVQRLNAAVRDGNGTPSLTTRMAVVEEHIKNYDEQQLKLIQAEAKTKTQDEETKRTKMQFRWALIIAIISGMLGMLQGAWAFIKH